MISLKRYIENYEDLSPAALRAYQAALATFGENSERAMPGVVPGFQPNLSRLKNRLASDVTAEVIEEIRQQLETELSNWGDGVASHLKATAAEIREVILVMAAATEAVGERDKKYASKFSDVTTTLRAIADLGDLTKIRPMLLASATELRNEISMMEDEGRESLSKLQSEIAGYRARLGESELRESRDSMTGLRNRRGIEHAIQVRREQGAVFSVIMMDLNHFKEVNDIHGHLAGDDLLKKFAAELTAHFRSTDVIGRWGGDEFIGIIDCDLPEARNYVERIRRWAFGMYTIDGGNNTVRVGLSAAVGLVTWNRKESATGLLARVDEFMYQDKKRSAPRG